MGEGSFEDSVVDVTYSSKSQGVDLELRTGIGHLKYYFISFFIKYILKLLKK